MLSAAVVLDVADTTAVEGHELNGPMTWNVRLSRPSTEPVTFTYSATALPGDTAVPGADFVRRSNRSLTMPAGQVARIISIDTKGDRLEEPAETFSLSILTVAGAQLGRGIATGTILDDDPGGTQELSLNDASIVEGDDGTATLVLQVRISEPSTSPVNVAWQTVDGSAIAGQDYRTSAGTVQVPLDKRSARISVRVYADDIAQGSRSLTVRLSSPSPGWTIRKAAGGATIVDDD